MKTLRLMLALLLIVTSTSSANADALFAAGSFVVSIAGAVNSTYDITTVGIAPKCALFFGNGLTNASDANVGQTARLSLGFADNSVPPIQKSKDGYSLDNSATADTAGGARIDAALAVASGVGAHDGYHSVESYLANGFRFKVLDQFATAWRFGYAAIGGSDLTDCLTGSFVAGAISPVSVALGWQPDGIIVLSPSGQSTDVNITPAAPFGFGIGFVDGTDANGLCYVFSQDGVTSNTKHYCRMGESWAALQSTGSAFNARGTIARTSTGFTATTSTGATNRIYYYLAFRGIKSKLLSMLTRTDTANNVSSSIGFPPQLVMVVSATNNESALGVPGDHLELTIGTSTAANTGFAIAVSDEDKTSGNSETWEAVDFDKIYINPNLVDAVHDTMAVTTFGADTLTFKHTSFGDEFARFFLAFVLGATTTSPTACQGRMALLGVGC
jgi:hypothetical protein